MGKPLAWPLMALVRGYQLLISPLLPPACRFYPSCSQYALEALREHGALRGGGLALWRLLRCHPFHPGGYDPVPHRVHSPLHEVSHAPTHAPSHAPR